MTMATRIVVMKDGIIQQVDTPQNLYDFPCNIFVAGFIGTPQMNFVNCRLVGKNGDVYLNFGENMLKLPADKANAAELKDYIGKEVIAGIRPELVHDDDAFLNSNPELVVPAHVDVTELMGAEIYIYFSCGEDQNMVARVSSRSTVKPDTDIKVGVDTTRVHIFDKDTERCIIH